MILLIDAMNLMKEQKSLLGWPLHPHHVAWDLESFLRQIVGKAIDTSEEHSSGMG
jgi:hypothetical protein